MGPDRCAASVRSDLRHQLSGRGGHRQAEHVVSSGDQHVSRGRLRSIDRQPIEGHRPPAPPLFLDRLGERLLQVELRRVGENAEPRAVQRVVVAGELHRRAEAVARRERRDRDAMFLEDQRMRRAERRPRHRQRVALPGLDRHAAAEFARSAAASRRRWRSRSDRPRCRRPWCEPLSPSRSSRTKPITSQCSRISTPSARQHAMQFAHQPVRPQVRIRFVEVAAGHARLEGRFECRQRRGVEPLRRHGELAAEQLVGVGVVLEVLRRPEDEEQPLRLPLAIEIFSSRMSSSKSVREEFRSAWMARPAASMSRRLQRRAKPRNQPRFRSTDTGPNLERRVALEERLERGPDRAGHRRSGRTWLGQT